MRRLAATAALALGACTHLPQEIKVDADGHTIAVKNGCVCVTPAPPGERGNEEQAGGPLADDEG